MTTKGVEKVTKTSENMENENLRKMQEVFPLFVKDGEIDFDALKAFFDKEGTLAGTEKYGLNWAGKGNAFRAIRTPSTGTLAPQEKESKNFDTTENIFIEGDNLEVLKLLQKHYREQIKMIYIDPPYNTGKDFIYTDNFTENKNDYYERTGQSCDGIKLTSNPESNGRYHSDWLTMMYPRLFLARSLMRNDGVIFVSIDDHEVANLRMIMDEIFGEENFVASIIWEKKYSPQNDATYFSDMHDYVICYAKNVRENKNSVDGFILNLLQRTDEQNARYQNPDNDPRGDWKSGDMSVKTYSLNYDFEIVTPTGRIVKPPKSRCWVFGREKYQEMLADNRIWFGADGNGIPSVKRFLSEVQQGIVPSTLWFREDVGDNQEAAKEIRDLFDTAPFDTPKPTRLIKRMLELSTGREGGGIILDFFAGSGTTAHAVMDLNAEDGGNRKLICVQIPEGTNADSEACKAGYLNIAQISRERIRRAGEKILQGATLNPQKGRSLEDLDVGFKAFSLSPSSYSEWNALTDKDSNEALDKQSKLFLTQPLITGFNERSVVYEILLKEGFDLNAHVKAPEAGDKFPIWSVVNTGERSRKMAITFAKKFTKEDFEKTGIGQTDNEIFVCLDSAIDDTTKVNAMRNLTVKVI